MEYEDKYTDHVRPKGERLSMSKATNGNGQRQQVEVCLCIPEDQRRYLPKRRNMPSCLPPHAPLPRQGDVVYLSSSSAWGVSMVVHELIANDSVRVEVWLEHLTSSRHSRPTGFMLTQ